MKKAYFNWSSGKDSALAYYKIMKSKEYEITTLFTSLNKESSRVSMHGVHIDLLKKQAEYMKMPLQIFELPSNANMDEYNNLMQSSVKKLGNVNTAIFGDIFLEDLKNYRVNQLKNVNIDCVFPLWNIDTKDVINEFINLGFKAIVTCIDANLLDKSFVGRTIDRKFIEDLPDNVDVCGENGEFHTFVYDGPIFEKKIEIKVTDVIFKEYENYQDKSNSYKYWCCDLELV